MSRVIDIFSLDVNEIVFNIDDNPWLTNTNNNSVTSSLLHESNNTNNKLFNNFITTTMINFRVIHALTARAYCIPIQ